MPGKAGRGFQKTAGRSRCGPAVSQQRSVESAAQGLGSGCRGDAVRLRRRRSLSRMFYGLRNESVSRRARLAQGQSPWTPQTFSQKSLIKKLYLRFVRLRYIENQPGRNGKKFEKPGTNPTSKQPDPYLRHRHPLSAQRGGGHELFRAARGVSGHHRPHRLREVHADSASQRPDRKSVV